MKYLTLPGKYILLLLFSMYFWSCDAQTSLGVKGGLNLARLEGNVAGDGYSALVAANAGLFVYHTISKSVAIEPELFFSRQGQKFNSATYNFKGKYRFDYLNVGVPVQLFPAKRLYLETGPQFGLLLSAHETYAVYGATPGTFSPTQTDDVSSHLKQYDFGLNFGLGYHFSKLIAANVRYYLGLVSLGTEDVVANFNYHNDFKNRVLSVNLFVSLFHTR